MWHALLLVDSVLYGNVYMAIRGDEDGYVIVMVKSLLVISLFR